MRTQHHCTTCGKLMAEESVSRQRKSKEHVSAKILRAREGASLSFSGDGYAPRVRCACGHLHILVKGSL